MTDMDNSIEATEESQAHEGQLEEVATDEPTTETTDTPESDEAVGETTTPKFLGKFSSAEEMAEAYSQLENKLSSQGKELSQSRRSSESESANDVSRDRVEEEVPKDELDEMLSDYREQKNQRQQESISKLDTEDFDKDAEDNPHIIPHKKILLKLGRSSEFRATPFSEIYESVKESFTAPLDDGQYEENKRNASSIKGSNNAKDKGVKQWTKQSIQKLSAKEFAKHESEIVKFLSKDTK